MSVKIVSMNRYGERAVASAARISTTEGDAFEIFERSLDVEKNRKLTRAVLRSGHRSVAEHAVFTIALKNVSVYAEQFFIEHRLASFTVKSRRYVDFAKAGYYLPSLPDGAESLFRGHVEYLFSEYDELTQAGVPKEDARFLLPYCFHSNFYCTINGRELMHLLSAIRYGRGRNCAELQAIADDLVRELETLCPFAAEIPKPPARCSVTEKHLTRLDLSDCTPNEAGIDLISHTQNTLSVLKTAAEISKLTGSDSTFGETDIAAVICGLRPRELEQISATYIMRGLSLAGLTHMARHRVQSLVVPPFDVINPRRYVLPDAIPESLKSRYVAAFERTHEVVSQIRTLGKFEEHYLALSGNTLDVMTTMNARELALFFRLRCCNRAQWEIQRLAVELLARLRNAEPQMYNSFGPSCYADGICPEGRLTCGDMQNVVAKFGGTL